MEEKKITLPSGAIAYIKPELTAGDADDIQEVYFEGANFDMNDQGKVEQKISFNGKLITKAKYRLLSICTLRIEKNGQTVSPVSEEYFRSMSMADIDMLKEECDKMNTPIREDVKKN